MRSSLAAALIPFALVACAFAFLLNLGGQVDATDNTLDWWPTPDVTADVTVHTYLLIDSQPVIEGNEITFGITCQNWSDNTANNVSIGFELPESTTYVNSSNPGFILVQNGSQVMFIRDRLSAFEQGWLSVTARIDDGTPPGTLLQAKATISTLDYESNYDNNDSAVVVTVLASQPDLSVRHDLYTGDVAANEEVTYRVSYSNRSGIEAHNTAITLTLPISTTYVSHTPNSNFTATVTDNTIVWTNPLIPALDWNPQRGYGDLYVTARVSDAYAAGEWLTSNVEISTSDAEYEYENNRTRLTVKPGQAGQFGAAVTSLDDSSLAMLNEGGFDWMLYYLDWSATEPTDNEYVWDELDAAVWQAWWHQMKLVVRVDRTPGWARSSGTSSAPPVRSAEAGRFPGSSGKAMAKNCE